MSNFISPVALSVTWVERSPFASRAAASARVAIGVRRIFLENTNRTIPRAIAANRLSAMTSTTVRTTSWRILCIERPIVTSPMVFTSMKIGMEISLTASSFRTAVMISCTSCVLGNFACAATIRGDR